MIRQSVFKSIFTWLKVASVDCSIQKQKFYTPNELYDICNEYFVKQGKKTTENQNSVSYQSFFIKLEQDCQNDHIRTIKIQIHKARWI